MGAAGSISDNDYSLQQNIKISNFCDEKLQSIQYIPNKVDCWDATFSGHDFGDGSQYEGGGALVPQKYIWLQGVCAAFVMFTDMGGKTLPELWDSYAGAGFTDHSTATMLGQAKQVMMRTLAPEIKNLINTDMLEEDNQDSWAIAIGKVEYRNLLQAHKSSRSGPETGTRKGNNSTSLMYALTGEADEEFPVSPKEWRDYVFTTDLFVQDGRWNGDSYTKAMLESIVGERVDENDIAHLEDEQA